MSAPTASQEQTVEQMWLAARRRYGNPRDCRAPGAGVCAVLVALLDGAGYGRELARRARVDRGNLSRFLARLERLRLVRVTEEVPAATVTPSRGSGVAHGGGRPAKIWALTNTGRELAGLLAGREGAK